MAWLGLDRLFLGVDLNAEQQRGAAADQRINQLNQEEVNRGYLPQDYANQAAADITDANSGFWQDTPGGGTTFVTDNHGTDPVHSVDQAFAEGASQGLNNVLEAPGHVIGAVGSGAGTLFGGILKNIPWWVWLVAAGGLFFWMGGLALLRGRLSRYA